MTLFGYLCSFVAVAWIIYKVYVAYTSFGGTTMATVYDAAMYAPILGVFGLYWVLKSFAIDFTIWIYLALWVGVATFVALAIRLAENMGDRRRY